MTPLMDNFGWRALFHSLAKPPLDAGLSRTLAPTFPPSSLHCGSDLHVVLLSSQLYPAPFLFYFTQIFLLIKSLNI